MDEQRPPQQGQVQIKADEKELQGQYSNLVMIHHNLEEFTMNFIYIFPNGGAGQTDRQHDRQPRPRETHLARAGRKYRAVRIAVRCDQGVSRRQRADAHGRLRSIGAGRYIANRAVLLTVLRSLDVTNLAIPSCAPVPFPTIN